MEDKKFAEKIHMIIHSLRLIPNYKSSNAEQKIGKLVREKFKDTCDECKEISEKIKNTPEKETMGNKLGKILGG